MATREQKNATRFVTSIEQMVPYLEEIGIYCDDDNELEDNNEVPPANGNSVSDCSYIYEEYVNFVDMSELNPIIEPWDCLQKDVLNEDEMELSERFV